MSTLFDHDKPIYLQIREKIEDQIVNDQLKEGEQAPSTNQLVSFYKINHATVSKGVNQLVEEGILFKKRGIAKNYIHLENLLYIYVDLYSQHPGAIPYMTVSINIFVVIYLIDWQLFRFFVVPK